MVTLQVKAQPFARNVDSQPRPIKFILNYPRDISYRDRLRKLSLLQLEYRTKIRFGTYVYKARADHVDHVFCQTVIQQRTRNSCELNYQVPLAKQH